MFAVSVGPDLGAAVAGDDRGGSGLVSMSPSRVLDTRETSGGSGPVAPGSPVTVELSGVPADAAAAVVNVTATNAQGSGFFSVWDCDGTAPGTSSGNYVGIGTVAANVITSTNADAEICVATGDAPADVLVDVMGYYPAGSGVVTIAPTRSLDTRLSSSGSGPVVPGSHVTATLDDIPADATAAIVNITATNATADGYFTVWDCDGPAPSTSNGNYVGVTTIANSAITPIGDQSQICVQTGDGAADILVDTVGYLTADSGCTAVSPARLLDTRDTDTPLAPGDTATITLADVPVGDTAIVNVTATNAQGDGFFTVWNCDGPAPGTSNGNYVGVTTIANTAIITPNADQQICVRTGDAAAHIIIDTTGHTTTTTPDPPPITTTTTTTSTTVPFVATITGRVTDGGSTADDGVSGAAVLLQRDGSTIDETTSATTPAAALGNYSFVGVSPGTYTVIATRGADRDKEMIRKTVEVTADDDPNFEVNLDFSEFAPTIIQVTARNANLLVTFAIPSEGVSTSTLYQYRLGDGAWQDFVTCSVGPCTIIGLVNGTTYEVRIRAGSGLRGPASNMMSGTPTA